MYKEGKLALTVRLDYKLIARLKYYAEQDGLAGGASLVAEELEKYDKERRASMKKRGVRFDLGRLGELEAELKKKCV
jgi:hypothetical protein